jgi:quinoprotein glucose dehydrogenase
MGLISCASADEIVALSQHPSPAVRLAAVVALRRLGDDRLVQFLTDSDTRVADETIRAIHDTSMEKVRPALAALLDDYAPGGNGRELTQMMLRRLIYSAFRLGGEKNIARLARVAANKNLSLVERTDITRLFGLWPKPPRVDHSTGVFHPLEERDPESFKKALAAYLPIMLSAESSILGKVMGLADQYSIPLDDLDSGTLTRLVRDEKINAATRVAALNLILKTNPDEAGELLAESASSNNDQLASAALKIAASRDPAANVATLKGALASKSVARRQEAWKVISKLPAEFSVPLLRDSLAELTAGKGDLGSALELLQAARANKKEPVISKLLADYQASIKDANLETRWAPSLAGGNPRNGFKIFQSHGAAQCMRCHRYKKGHSEGGNAGPNLAGVARRHDAKGLLASLLAPSAEIATGFGLATLTFHNQTQKTGMILRDGENTLDFQEAETVWKISKDKITHTATLPSAMPTMEGILNPREIRDVVAWLLTLTKESGETSATYETTALVLEESPEPKQKIESNQVSDTIDPVIMETGKSLYDKAGSCITCHQATGAGIPGAFPPLTESDWVSGPIENLIRIQLHGLQGEIQVNGATYNGMMPAVPDAIFPQTDENIAAVLTYVRNSFGNSAPAVTPEMVATIREEGPRGPLTMDDVVDLTGPDRFIKEVSAIVGGEQATPIALAEIPSTGLGASVWGIAAFLIIGGLSLGAALKMKASS